MDELSRHIIHACQVLKVIAEIFKGMDNHFNYHTDQTKEYSYKGLKEHYNNSLGPFKALRTYSSILMHLEKMAESLDRRLHEELQLVSLKQDGGIYA
jgi:hypothetical protein